MEYTFWNVSQNFGYSNWNWKNEFQNPKYGSVNTISDNVILEM